MSLSRPCENYISISLLQGLVNTFLKLFSFPLYRSPSRDNLIILSSSLTIVNYFFKLFRFFKLTSLARQLNYSIKSYPSLSSSFSNFFRFFSYYIFWKFYNEVSHLALLKNICFAIFEYVLISFYIMLLFFLLCGQGEE